MVRPHSALPWRPTPPPPRNCAQEQNLHQQTPLRPDPTRPHPPQRVYRHHRHNSRMLSHSHFYPGSPFISGFWIMIPAFMCCPGLIPELCQFK